jgi:hypothetical protein
MLKGNNFFKIAVVASTYDCMRNVVEIWLAL